MQIYPKLKRNTLTFVITVFILTSVLRPSFNSRKEDQCKYSNKITIQLKNIRKTFFKSYRGSKYCVR